MAKLLIAFEKRNVRLWTGRWLFKREQPMRFEWIALMAYKRLTLPVDHAWVSLKETSQLPSWGGKSRHDTSTNIGRYLRSADLKRIKLVSAQTVWAGPYRLNVDPLSIQFDCSLSEVRNRLRLHPKRVPRANRTALFSFTVAFTRAQKLFFAGRLRQKGLEDGQQSAYDILMRMTGKRFYTPTLRFLALLSAVDVLFRLGRYQVARQTLRDYQHRLRSTDDESLKARFYVRLAWSCQRGSSGIRSDRAVEAALEKATFHAQKSGDRATQGMIAYRTVGYRTKQGLHMEAITQLLFALETDMLTGNYDFVQRDCAQIGSIIHRLGPSSYPESRRWLVLSIVIARMMNLGRDDAHAEMILGKIHTAWGHRYRAQSLLQRAQRIAERAGNRVNLADVKMVWGFWYRRFGTREEVIETLRNALADFLNIPEFDVRQKTEYMESRFPEVWQDVVAHLSPRVLSRASYSGVEANRRRSE